MCTQAYLEYRLRLIGSDVTGSAEFLLQRNVAQSIIIASVQKVILDNYRGDYSVNNLAAAATQIKYIPPKITTIVSWKFKFVVSVAPSSFQRSWVRFTIYAVEKAYPPE